MMTPDNTEKGDYLVTAGTISNLKSDKAKVAWRTLGASCRR